MNYILLIDDNIVKGHITGYEESNVIGYAKADVPDDFEENFTVYKLVGNNIKKMSEAEVASCKTAILATDEELLGQLVTQAEIERMELAQRLTDMELILLEGGNEYV